MKRRIYTTFVLALLAPHTSWASCSGVASCDPSLDSKIISAKVSCFRNNIERSDIEFLQGSACEYLPKDGFYTCYRDVEKNDKWREMYCENKKSIGIGLEYFYDKIVTIEIPVGPDNHRVIKQIELPEGTKFKDIEKWRNVGP